MKKRNLQFSICAILGLVALIVTARYCTRGDLLQLGKRDLKTSADVGPVGSKKSHEAISDPIRALTEAYRTPIEFYGRVVDQHGDPVAGATVRFSAVSTMGEDSSPDKTLTTDVSGTFSVKGLKGAALGVRTEKEGYLMLPASTKGAATSSRMIYYATTDDKGMRYKDPGKPTIFTLHKLGPLEPMMYIEDQRWRLPLDGTIRKIALDTKKGIGPHQIEFRFTTEWATLPDEPGVNFKRFNWRLEARIPGGGFVRNRSDYAFEAPESGYEEKITIDYPRDAPNWEKFAKRRYFVRFSDGTHARIRFDISGDSDTGPLLMTSWMNLKPGSRNLASEKMDTTVMWDE